jgi:hypothetical protein
MPDLLDQRNTNESRDNVPDHLSLFAIALVHHPPLFVTLKFGPWFSLAFSHFYAALK